MKKLLSLLLASMMLFSCAALAEGAPEPLGRTEVDQYLAEIGKLVAAMPDVETTDNGDGTACVDFPGGSLIIEGSEMTADAHVVNARVDGWDLPGLRGVGVGATMADLLAAYPNDNAYLSGNRYEATLYISGEKPQVSLGYLLRDGQRVYAVAHETFFWEGDIPTVCNAAYELEDGAVLYFVVDAAFWDMDAEEADGSVAEYSRIQETNEYFAYPSSEDGSVIAPLEREDLSFRTLIALAYENASFDFIDLNYNPRLEQFGDPYDEMIDVFGMPQVDEWNEDSTGEQLRTLQWDGVSLVLVYDAQKKYERVDSLTINKDVAEGPRGVRIGDLLDSVLFRFRHVEEVVDDSRVLLYGNGQEPPYGVLTYGPDSAELSYALALEDAKVYWHLSFTDGRLQSMSMLLR